MLGFSLVLESRAIWGSWDKRIKNLIILKIIKFKNYLCDTQ